MDCMSLYAEALVSGNEFTSMEKRQLEENTKFRGESGILFYTYQLTNYRTLVFSIQIQKSKHWIVDLSLQNSLIIQEAYLRVSSGLNRLLCNWFNLPKKELAIARLSPGIICSLTVSSQFSVPKPSVQVKCLVREDRPRLSRFNVVSEKCQCRPLVRNLKGSASKNVFVNSFFCLLGTWFILECCNSLPDQLQFTFSVWESVLREDVEAEFEVMLISKQFLTIGDGTLLSRNRITSLYAFPILSRHSIIDPEQVRDDLYRFYYEKYFYDEELIAVKAEFSLDDMEIIEDRVIFFFFEGRPANGTTY